MRTNVNDYLGMMVEDRASKMFEDELKDLSINLLREWWLTTVQAFLI
jgi:hypothetical protein